MTDRIVAIDGTAGSGKSTLARGLAAELGLPYVNTGSMYRAVAAAALREGVDADDVASLTELSSRLRFRLRDGDPAELEVEGWTADELATEGVESVVSAVSRHPEVRAVLRGAQRSLGRDGAVMEGRDIGSVVFPNAAVKLHLVADPSVRADRRSAERSSGTMATRSAIAARDARDAVTTPPEPAAGAQVIDTTDLDVGGVLDAALGVIARSAPELLLA